VRDTSSLHLSLFDSTAHDGDNSDAMRNVASELYYDELVDELEAEHSARMRLQWLPASASLEWMPAQTPNAKLVRQMLNDSVVGDELVQQLTSHERRELTDSGIYAVCSSFVLESKPLHDNETVPGLSDNGASLQSSCAKSLDGAILSTFRGSDCGSLDVGEDGVALVSRGSYLYMLERSGTNGVTELVLRRMKHTPSLKLHYVFSEPTEVHMHGYSFAHDQRGRFMSTDCGVCIKLNMSSARLGWLAVRPIVLESEQRSHFHTLSRHVMSNSMLLPDCGVCSEK
jgi:hypothetical protein